MDLDNLEIEISASSADAIKHLEALTEQLKELRAVASGGAGLRSVNSQLGKLGSASEKIGTKNFKSLIKSFASIGAKSYVLNQVADVLEKCVSQLNEYVENVNLFQVAMGDFYDEAYDYAMLVNDRLGVDPSQWMRTQGVFMSMANGFGVAKDTAYELSKGLTELSYDISSLYNEDVERSAQRLQSALAGEIEPIRRLGISISQATLQEYALAHGITEAVASMNDQEKALLRSSILLEKAADMGIVGDFAKTLESPANALRVLGQQFTQLARSVGSVFIPILLQVIPVVQAVVSVITSAISALASLIGFVMPSWNNSGWESTTESAADLEKNLGGAGGAAKELKKALFGFDELNVLPDQNAGGGGGGGGSIDTSWADKLQISSIWTDEMLNNIQTKVDHIKTAIEDVLPLIGLVGAAFATWKLTEIVTSMGGLGNALSSFRGHLPELTKQFPEFAAALPIVALATIVAQFVNLATTSEEFREGLGRAKTIVSTFGKVAKEIFKGITNVIKTFIPDSVLSAIDDLGDKFFKMCRDMELNTGDLATTLVGLTLLILPGGQIPAAFVLGFEAMTIALRAFGGVSDEEWAEMETTVKKAMYEIRLYFVDVARDLKEKLTDIKDWASGHWEVIKTGFSNAWVAIGDVFGVEFGEMHDGLDEFGKDAEETYSGIQTSAEFSTSGIEERFKEMIDYLKNNAAQDIFDSITKPFKDIANFVNETVEGIKTKLSEIGSSFKKSLEEAWSGFQDIFSGKAISNLSSSISNAFKSTMNSFISGLNSALRSVAEKINSMVYTIRYMKIFGTQPFLSLTGVKAPQIPYLATGGFPQTGQMFIANEAGPELVGTIGGKTAVVNNDQIIAGISRGVSNANNEVVNAIFAIGQQIIQSIENKDNNSYMDGELVSNQVTKRQNQNSRMFGTSMIYG